MGITVYIVFGVLKVVGAALLGFLLGIVLDIYSSGAKPQELTWQKWWGDNKRRVLASILCITAGLIFSEDIFGVKLNPLMAFWAGLGNDALINMFVRRRANLNKKES